MGPFDGLAVGTEEEKPEGPTVASRNGIFEGLAVGSRDGISEGPSEGLIEGSTEGILDRVAAGAMEDEGVGLDVGMIVGAAEGFSDCNTEGSCDGILDGPMEDARVGCIEGGLVGEAEGLPVGEKVGLGLGMVEGYSVGTTEGNCEGVIVGCGVFGSLMGGGLVRSIISPFSVLSFPSEAIVVGTADGATNPWILVIPHGVGLNVGISCCCDGFALAPRSLDGAKEGTCLAPGAFVTAGAAAGTFVAVSNTIPSSVTGVSSRPILGGKFGAKVGPRGR